MGNQAQFFLVTRPGKIGRGGAPKTMKMTAMMAK
jgi:hypothetical protein